MGVKTEYQAVISCDYCPNNLVEAYRHQKEVIAEARRMGWSIGKTVKCPKCRQEKYLRIAEEANR